MNPIHLYYNYNHITTKIQECLLVSTQIKWIYLRYEEKIFSNSNSIDHNPGKINTKIIEQMVENNIFISFKPTVEAIVIL